MALLLPYVLSADTLSTMKMSLRSPNGVHPPVVYMPAIYRSVYQLSLRFTTVRCRRLLKANLLCIPRVLRSQWAGNRSLECERSCDQTEFIRR